MILNKPYEIEKTKYLYATNFYLFKHIGPGNENGADRFPQKIYLYKYDYLKRNINTIK